MTTFTAEDVAPIRSVNGVAVRMTDAERSEIAAEWTRNDADFRARLAEHQLGSMKEAALRALTAANLQQEMGNPDAPQEVREYAAALNDATAR